MSVCRRCGSARKINLEHRMIDLRRAEYLGACKDCLLIQFYHNDGSHRLPYRDGRKVVDPSKIRRRL